MVSNSLIKTVATGWENAAGAISEQPITASGRMEFMAYETNTTRICGLSQTHSRGNQLEIDFGIAIREDGYVAVYENGVLKGPFTTYDTGDVLIVDREGSIVRYKIRRYGQSRDQEQTLYTSQKSSYGTLYVDAALYHINSTIVDAKIY